jgi:hypothetical protein
MGVHRALSQRGCHSQRQPTWLLMFIRTILAVFREVNHAAIVARLPALANRLVIVAWLATMVVIVTKFMLGVW